MQPEEQPQHPIDYLDSISTAPKTTVVKGKSDLVFFGVLIGGLLIALLVGAFAILNGGNTAKDDLATLSVRLKNLQEVTDSSQKKIISSSLRASNTSLSLVLTNANRDIAEPLKENGIVTKEIDPKITSREKTDELMERLEDARLNAVFDRVYTREMSYQIQTVIILLEQLEDRTKDKSQKEFLETTHQNLKPLKERFATFDAASS